MKKIKLGQEKHLEKIILKRNFLVFDLEDLKILYVWVNFQKIWKMVLYWFCGWKGGGVVK